MGWIVPSSFQNVGMTQESLTVLSSCGYGLSISTRNHLNDHGETDLEILVLIESPGYIERMLPNGVVLILIKGSRLVGESIRGG